MPYDLYERHAVVSRLLQKRMDEGREAIVAGGPHILDVGGRAELLERFVPHRVISVNIDGSGHLVGSGCILPFVDSSFVAVVSIDTLEHLPREARLPFLRECLRVAQRYVVVAAPFGSDGHSQCEKRLADLYLSMYGRPHTYLSEHIRYGLPNMAELDQFACELEAADSRCLFAGDYVWQSKQFERAIAGRQCSKWGLLTRLWNVYKTLISLAIFHPIQLRDRPDAAANRFYLFVEKKRADGDS
jgi:hypothetical protein